MLRLQNGVYLQLHAYMFRVAIPYGRVASKRLRRLAHVARRYDRGYGHFTTRQNIQFNWIKLAELPDALADLAEVGIHAMQTSGNNTRNVTSDQWAGVAPGEIEDPRIWSEILRQYTTLHPEFSFLPRKFKFAITASAHDRAAIKIHDIGLRLHKNDQGETGFEVLVGGGLGRTPFIAKTIKPFVHGRDLLSYVEAILPVYNQYGRCRSSRSVVRRATPRPSRWMRSPISPTNIRPVKSASGTNRILRCPMSPSATCRRCGRHSTSSGSRRRTSISCPISSPVRGSI